MVFLDPDPSGREWGSFWWRLQCTSVSHPGAAHQTNAVKKCTRLMLIIKKNSNSNIILNGDRSVLEKSWYSNPLYVKFTNYIPHRPLCPDSTHGVLNFIYLFIYFACSLVAILRPNWREKKKRTKNTILPYVILLNADISWSSFSQIQIPLQQTASTRTFIFILSNFISFMKPIYF